MLMTLLQPNSEHPPHAEQAERVGILLMIRKNIIVPTFPRGARSVSKCFLDRRLF
ncbi:hypothetical protein J8C06_13740 [Chloracidobacterium validum]|uniref:Uncharacterized protein n=1 Tax=Chloracidobacterium validum TaxID=2821543 RepID=A0ABX8BEL8_9BACT|nr:hypothetical protein [Chloracidobacterium validum]QUW04109.1 hypothetical protein J8C06_13740 [Chloracidobacterium validum]